MPEEIKKLGINLYKEENYKDKYIQFGEEPFVSSTDFGNWPAGIGKGGHPTIFGPFIEALYLISGGDERLSKYEKLLEELKDRDKYPGLNPTKYFFQDYGPITYSKEPVSIQPPITPEDLKNVLNEWKNEIFTEYTEVVKRSYSTISRILEIITQDRVNERQGNISKEVIEKLSCKL